MDNGGANTYLNLPIINGAYRVSPGGSPSGSPTQLNYNYEYLTRIGCGLDTFEGSRYGTDMDTTWSGAGGFNTDYGQRKVLTVVGDAIGFVGEVNAYNRSYHYSTIGTQILPIRNKSGSPITITVYYEFSAQYGDAGGSRIFYIEPNATTYSATTGVTYTSVATYGPYQDADSTNIGFNGTSVTVPAGKTILLVVVNTFRATSSYQHNGINKLFNLATTFSNASIVCDLRMVDTLAYAPLVSMGYNRNIGTGQEIYKIWNYCGTLHGNR
jgi:hypothetical protein